MAIVLEDPYTASYLSSKIPKVHWQLTTFSSRHCHSSSSQFHGCLLLTNVSPFTSSSDAGIPILGKLAEEGTHTS